MFILNHEQDWYFADFLKCCPFTIRGYAIFRYRFRGEFLLKHIEGKFIGTDMFWIFINTDL